VIKQVTPETIADAAFVHAEAWQASHRSFCTPAFVALHTPARQQAYLQGKIDAGTRVYLLTEEIPVGLVSVTGNLIEDLYILPAYQNRGYGTLLLHYAMERCDGTPTLWILENNTGAERLYRREGFLPTGGRNAITDGLDEIELALDE